MLLLFSQNFIPLSLHLWICEMIALSIAFFLKKKKKSGKPPYLAQMLEKMYSIADCTIFLFFVVVQSLSHV